MHPLLSNRNNLLLYLMAWAILGCMLGFYLGLAGRLGFGETVCVTVPVVVALAVVCLGAWYPCRMLPPGSTPVWKLIGNHLLAAICCSAIALIVAHIAVVACGGIFPRLSAHMKLAGPLLAGISVLFYLLSVAMHYALLAFESSRRAELLSREAELKALKAQVNPHFLFNSLNSISALTSIDPPKAREMCIRLSEFLRNSLRLGERLSIPFGEELMLAKTYLQVEQIRFGQRLCVREDMDPNCAECQIPPLLVQPLIENAIKHGIATLACGGEIAVKTRRSRDSVRVTIENPYDPEAPAGPHSGFGLLSVRNRLQARFGAAGRLDIEIERDRYRVILSLPCQTGRETAKELPWPA
ncbi:MAG: sensor histidine kinase [Bryobacteraceae bacterium]